MAPPDQPVVTPVSPAEPTAEGDSGPQGSDQRKLIEALRSVIDPELHVNLVDLGMIGAVERDPDDPHHVVVTLALTTEGCPLRARLRDDIESTLLNLGSVNSVKTKFRVMNGEERARAMGEARKVAAEHQSIENFPTGVPVVLVASGKGGVGKSSVTVNLAAALAARGTRVGVLDADIWGFSVPQMLGAEGHLAVNASTRKIVPTVVTLESLSHDPSPRTTRVGGRPGDQGSTDSDETEDGPTARGDIRVVSMGLLVEGASTALMWRGLILNRAVRHFLEDVDWTGIEMLLVDMPPGTGDVQMGLARMLPQAEMLVVTTPALAAQQVAARVLDMGHRSHLRTIGVVENMSAFVSPGGERFEIFGSGGGQRLAEETGAPLIGEIPIETAVSAGGDSGYPAALGSGPAATAFDLLATAVLTHFEAAEEADDGCTARMFAAMDALLDAADTA